jgi:hypothetical protein
MGVPAFGRGVDQRSTLVGTATSSVALCGDGNTAISSGSGGNGIRIHALASGVDRARTLWRRSSFSPTATPPSLVSAGVSVLRICVPRDAWDRSCVGQRVLALAQRCAGPMRAPGHAGRNSDNRLTKKKLCWDRACRCGSGSSHISLDRNPGYAKLCLARWNILATPS